MRQEFDDNDNISNFHESTHKSHHHFLWSTISRVKTNDPLPLKKIKREKTPWHVNIFTKIHRSLNFKWGAPGWVARIVDISVLLNHHEVLTWHSRPLPYALLHSERCLANSLSWKIINKNYDQPFLLSSPFFLILLNSSFEVWIIRSMDHPLANALLTFKI